MNNNLEQIINKSLSAEVASRITADYSALQKKLISRDWKGMQIEIAHIVEHIRRFLENTLLNSPIDYKKKLPDFNQQSLNNYENAKGDESFRLNVPRILYAMSTTRNKRSVAHTNEVIANKMDALYMLTAVKWCLGEIIRVKAKIAPNEINELIEGLFQREHEIVWMSDTTTRILNPGVSSNNQVLLLLYFKEKMTDFDLKNAIEYKNYTNFRNKVLKKLHKERLIEYQINGECLLLPPGIKKVEEELL